jgi:hypothetical protein
MTRRDELARSRRRKCLELKDASGPVHIRDQAPLHRGAITLQGGWDFEELVEHINRHVFFWPGEEGGPIREGNNHFERYRLERPVLLRMLTVDLFQANAALSPLFCKYNSGAPRCTRGKGSPRGPDIYTSADAFCETAGRVKEVVFRGSVCLPARMEVGDDPKGPWSAPGDAA